MGHRSRFAALAAALFASACGDPFVVIGDSPGTFRIVAGVPDSTGSEVGATATETLLQMPIGLAADMDGTVYIADHGNARVLALLPSGGVEVLVDGDFPEPRPAAPHNLAVTHAGSLLITDPGSHRVFRLDPASGALSPVAGTGQRGAGPDTVDALTTPLETPTGIAVASDGTVFFTESFAHRIRRLDASGTLTTFAGIGVPGFAGDDNPARSARFRNPSGLAIADGRLYVADTGNNRIRVIDLTTGIITTAAGAGSGGFGGDGGPAGEALLNAPLAVAAADRAGTIYVGDTDNHRVRAVSLGSGTIWTFAGTGTTDFNGDLLAVGETALNSPQGLSLSELGLLIVSDTGHHIVRRTAVALIGSP
jgi:DNA-binding beta-propeller fold protein YncE